MTFRILLYTSTYITLATIHQVPRQADINPVISHIDLSFFLYSKEIFFNIERNDMLIQNICYLSVIAILNCQLPDCNENMKKKLNTHIPL